MSEAAAGRGRLGRLALAAFMLGLAAILVALGVWQVERRAWKLDLIGRVEARVHAAPAEPPEPAGWGEVKAADAEYRHVRLRGRFVPAEPALTQAVTERGGGRWVLQPFRTVAGFTVLVNRGFVPQGTEQAEIAPPPEGESEVTGLLRLTEPEGGFLQQNDPAGDRWYSRDVEAIAAARGLGPVAPYFVDEAAAAAASGAGVQPVGGLTVLRFSNNHLVYALTWFAMAALALVGLVLVLRSGRPFRPVAPA